MAYRDHRGRITIDEVAARKDIKRIDEAIQRLNMARSALNQLHSTSVSIKGNTGHALEEKSMEIIGRLNASISYLEMTKSAVQKTVAKYQRLDREVKQLIQNGDR